MNITFLLRSFGIGGVNVVSSVLANKFLEDGHNVSVFTFYKGTDEIRSRFDNRIPIVIGNGFECNKKNILLLRNFIIGNKTQVIINQWGLPYVPIKTLMKAQKELQIKIISVYHNDPLQNGKIQDVEKKISTTSNWLKNSYLKIKKNLIKKITSFSMGYVYNHSDKFIVLSPSYITNFKIFTKNYNPHKIEVIPNPITCDSNGFVYDKSNKQTEIIYVGRLDQTQKCVQRIITIWAHLEKKFPNWCLSIVGDGPDRKNLEQLTKEMNLNRVSFEGIQNPRPYYERASILLLTSDFEGFPLVLAEAMQFGVIPVVYDSFAAVRDIIDDGFNGLIIPKPYNIDNTTKIIESLLNDETLRYRMSNAAIKRSKDFSIDKIAKIWYSLILNTKTFSLC